MLGGGTLLLGARSGPQDEQTAIVWGGVWCSILGAHVRNLLSTVLKGIRAPVVAPTDCPAQAAYPPRVWGCVEGE
eukprot:35078-Pelagomonas_calceolata.AAC.1